MRSEKRWEGSSNPIKNLIAMAETGDVYISKNIDVYDLLDDGNIEN